jgi:hypothetical protein
MTRDEIKDVLLEIIKDIDEEAELNLLKPDQSLFTPISFNDSSR